MKSISLIISAAALFSSLVFAATCNITFPSCEQMGYTETKGTCAGKYTVCPSDTNKVTCIDGPFVGALKYSIRPPIIKAGCSATENPSAKTLILSYLMSSEQTLAAPATTLIFLITAVIS